MRKRWTPITRNTKRLFLINFSLKHQGQHKNQQLNQKVKILDDETKRGAEMRHVAENKEYNVV